MEQRKEKDQLEDGVSLRGRMTEHQARGKRGERHQGLEAADGRVIWKGCSCIRSVWAEGEDWNRVRAPLGYEKGCELIVTVGTFIPV